MELILLLRIGDFLSETNFYEILLEYLLHLEFLIGIPLFQWIFSVDFSRGCLYQPV